MSYQNYMNSQKPGSSSSRFSTLKVFKLKPGSGSGSKSSDAPPPPPKDSIYSSSPSTPSSLLSYPHHSPNPANFAHNASLNPPSLSSHNKSLYTRSATSLSLPPSLSPSPSTSQGEGEGPRTPLTPGCVAGLEGGGGGMGGDFTRIGVNIGGRGAAPSPVPSNSGTSLRSVSGGGPESVISPSSTDGSTDSSGSHPNLSATSRSNPNASLNPYGLGLGGTSPSGGAGGPNSSMANLANAIKSKKSMFKLSSLGKRNFSKSRRDLSEQSSHPGGVPPSRSASVSECEDGGGAGTEGDEGISTPWNFQHHIHVDEGYIGLPPSWSSALSGMGFSAEEIAAIHARRKAVAAAAVASSSMGMPNPHTHYSTERPASPLSTTHGPTLLSPVPRGTSLGKLGGGLRVDPVGAHPPSIYSVASSANGTSINGGASPAPSPRAPSFGMKSFMSNVGLRSSKVTDGSSVTGGGEREEGTVEEESEQYVFVDGDGPDVSAEGMGDDTLIEPYPFDAASVSTHQTHGSRTQGQTLISASGSQGTNQIQIQRAQSDSGHSGHIPFPITSSRAPSPLVHSASLPIPTPPRGYIYSSSPSPSPSHSLVSVVRPGSRPGAATAPPRTPPRRIYHVVNASSDSYDGQNYGEPPPAYVSPKRGDWVPRKEKEALGAEGAPPPTRPVPPVPVTDLEGQSSRTSNDDPNEDGDDDDIYGNAVHTDIPATADDVLDISTANSSFYSDADASSHAERLRVLTPTPPLVIDKRFTKLGTLPPRISFHQEGSLEDWTEALFSAIDGGDGKGKATMNKRESKRFSMMFGAIADKSGTAGNEASVKTERRTTLRPMFPLASAVATGDETRSKAERRTTLRPMSPLATAVASGSGSASTSSSSSPLLPDMSFGANISLGAHVRQSEVTIDEREEHEVHQEKDDEPPQDVQEHEGSEESDGFRPPSSSKPVPDSPPLLLDVSLGLNVSSLGKDLRMSTSSSSTSASPSSHSDQTSPESKASMESPPPPPVPPKPQPSLPSIALKPSYTSLAPKSLLSTLGPPRANTVPGIEVKSPVSPVPLLFGKPTPLPLPIPPSQIKAQLRPPNTKLAHSKSSSSLASEAQGQTPFESQPQEACAVPNPDSTSLPIPQSRTESNSCPSSSTSLLPTLPSNNPGDRDSGMSTMTVTPATIVMVKGEVVRRAVASVVDSDAVSLLSKRESVLPREESVASASRRPDSERGAEGGSAVEDVDDSNASSYIVSRVHTQSPSAMSSTSRRSISPARNSPRSLSSPTWPSPPPPPPVELDTDATPRPLSRFRTTSLGRVSQIHQAGLASPISSRFSLRSSETHRSSETVSTTSSESAMINTPKSLGGMGTLNAVAKGKGKAGIELAAEAKMLVSTTNTFGGVEVDSESDGEDQDKDRALHPSPQQPQISATSSSSSQTLLPSSPSPHLLAFSQQHLSPSRPGIHPFISSLKSYLSPIDPIPYFTDLVEIAEGESGSVYAARVSASAMPEIRSAGEREIQAGTSHVAIKRIILPSSPTLDPASTSTDDSPLVSKVSSLLHELTLLKGIEHEHLLLLDAVYATSNDADTAGQASTAVDSSLWIRMELMERSLADVIGLVSEGLALQERMVGRFASDVLLGLEYLQKQHVAHRDVRSDNLLLNAGGIVKIADFSNAIRVTRNAPMVTGAVGVMYWQAPEMRAGPYNALKVDVWSLGATVWELAETVPPFSMPASPSTHTTFALARHPGSQWPPLSHPEHYSKAFHEFLRHCGRDPNGRPGPAELLNTPLIRNACGRAVILQLLSQCRSIEESMIARENSDRDS